MSLDGMREKGRRWWPAIVCSVGFCLVGLAFVPGLVSRAPTPAPTPVVLDTREPTRSVDMESVRPESIGATVHEADPVHLPWSETYDCMISANETVAIGSSILGVIEAIDVERSDYVEAGQVVARLESSVEEAAVAVAKARAERTAEVESTRVSLELGNKRRSRAADLYEGDTLSLDLREEVETEARLAELGVVQAMENHRLAKLQLEQARATLGRRRIRTPVSGFVVERLMAPGEVVDEETIMTIAQVDPLRVDVILPTSLFGSIDRGNRVEIVPEAPLDEARVAEVAIVDRVLDAASGTFGVRLMLPNPDHDLPGGLRCQARLLDEKPEPDALAANGAR